jgi:UDP-N-acetylmuramyl tripeptide synthase
MIASVARGEWVDGRRTAAARAASRLVGALSRRLARGEGVQIGGRAFVALASPRGLERMARRSRSVLVSGTNGKTTTTALIARAAATVTDVVSNSSGANLLSGVFGALAERPEAELAVLEVDELALPTMMRMFEPAVVVALNLTRDQLDRVHEVRRTARLWSDAFASFHGVVVANADDPLVVWAVRASGNIVWIAGGRSWIADATACPECTAPITIDEQGSWTCTGCTLTRPSTPDVRVAPPTGMPGRCNEANAAMAYAVLEQLGMEQAAGAWPDVTSVGGRYEHCDVEGRDVRLLLAKNPAGWLEALDLVDDDRALVLALNSRTEDGTDPSWIWDVPFEQLRATSVVCTGERAADLAVRVGYAGVATTIERDVRAAVLLRPAGGVDVVANYSAFQDARRRLVPSG